MKAEGREAFLQLGLLRLKIFTAHLAPHHFFMAVGNLVAGHADDCRAHHRVKHLGGAWHRTVRTNVLYVIEHDIIGFDVGAGLIPALNKVLM